MKDFNMKNSKFYVMPLKGKKCIKIVNLKRLKKRYVIISPSFFSDMMKRNRVNKKTDELSKLLPSSDGDDNRLDMLENAIFLVETYRQKVESMKQAMQRQNEMFQKFFSDPLLKLLPRGMFPTQNGLVYGMQKARNIDLAFMLHRVAEMEIAAMWEKRARETHQFSRTQAALAAETSFMAPTTPGQPSTPDQEPTPESKMPDSGSV